MITLRFPYYWLLDDCLWVVSHFGLVDYTIDRDDCRLFRVRLAPGAAVPQIPEPVIVEVVA